MDSKSEPSEGSQIIRPPGNHPDLTRRAERALREAGIRGQLPTDLDRILEAADVSVVEDRKDIREDFLSSLVGRVKGIARSALTKVKGIADLREKAVWVAKSDRPQGIMFPKAHEAAHQLLPWHHVKLGYRDTSETLSPEVEDVLEREANFMAGELIFQGDIFKERALGYEASLEAALKLADNHLATYQSTIWKYVEVQDEAIAVAQYYPMGRDIYDEQARFELWRTIGSGSFHKKCGSVELPHIIDSSTSAWPHAVGQEGVCSGACQLPCAGSKLRFTWQSWCNRYTLFVLIRRRPALDFIGNAVRRINQ